MGVMNANSRRDITVLVLQQRPEHDNCRDSEPYTGGQMPSEASDTTPSRRAFLARFAGAAFVAPVIASFALDGVAQASEKRGPYRDQHSQSRPWGGHPHQGYPNQGSPNQAYPNQGCPNMGMPNQTLGDG